MKQLIILVGNIGSGKTTKCKEFVNQGYVIISKDDLRYSIGAGNYIFNLDYEPKIDYITKESIHQFMLINTDIVIDETNMDKKTRSYYIELGKSFGYEIEAVIFPAMTMDASVARRLSNNHGDTPKEVWEEVWTRKHEAYEPPSLDEGFTRITQL